MNKWESEELPVKWVEHTLTYHDANAKEDKVIPVNCYIDRLEENGCLECTLTFRLPQLLLNPIFSFKLPYDAAMKNRVKASVKPPERIHSKYILRFTCDRLGKDYHPIQDEYNKVLNLDPSLYKGINYMKTEAKNYIKFVKEKVDAKIYYLEL